MRTHTIMLAALLCVGAMPAGAAELSPAWSAALAALQKEQKVHKVWIRGQDTPPPTLLVMVRDDGTNRSGYAEYVCCVLGEHGVQPDVLVRMMDADAFRRDRAERELGATICR